MFWTQLLTSFFMFLDTWDGIQSCTRFLSLYPITAYFMYLYLYICHFMDCAGLVMSKQSNIFFWLF
jgi:hypothetical protein